MQGTPAPELPSLGGSLAISIVYLGLICLLAWVALRWLSRRGVGTGMGPLRVVARLPLEPRRSVYLIEAAGRCFLIGAGEGPMSLLAEVDPKAVALPARPQPLASTLKLGEKFGEVLARLRAGPARAIAATAAAPVTSGPAAAPTAPLNKPVTPAPSGGDQS